MAWGVPNILGHFRVFDESVEKGCFDFGRRHVAMDFLRDIVEIFFGFVEVSGDQAAGFGAMAIGLFGVDEDADFMALRLEGRKDFASREDRLVFDGALEAAFGQYSQDRAVDAQGRPSLFEGGYAYGIEASAAKLAKFVRPLARAGIGQKDFVAVSQLGFELSALLGIACRGLDVC